MPRRRRIHFPGATYHVLLRGNNKRDIFTRDSERNKFASLLGEGVERFGHRVVAFCLMTNHVHLAIQVDEVPLADIVQNISFRYTRYFNYRHDRIGHLFQGRYKALLIDSEAYLRELIRYIHLNPVRAKLVSAPSDYTWSSHRAYLGDQDIPWLARESGLGHFGDSTGSRVKAYLNFVQRGVDPWIWEQLHLDSSQGVLGDDEFVNALFDNEVKPSCRKQATLDQIISMVCGSYGVAPMALHRSDRRSSFFRAVVALLAKRTCGTSMQEFADFVGTGSSALSKAVSRLEARMRRSDSLKREVGEIEDGLPQEEII